MSEVPTLLTGGFAESLRIVVKDKNAGIAKTIANYIHWKLVLEMSAVYPMLAADPSNRNGPEEVLDRLTLFKLWLRCGGDAKTRDRHGQHAIMKALEDEDWELFVTLVENGAGIDSRWESKTALHLVSGCGGERFLPGRCDDSEANDRAGLGRNRKAAVEALLKLGANIEASDENQNTALHHASRGGHQDVVKFLLANGADIEAKSQGEVTALHLASEHGHKEVVEILLRYKATIETRGHKTMTALHLASGGGHKGVVEALLRHGSQIEAQGHKMMTALHLASDAGHEDVVEALLAHGADIEAKDIHGVTAQVYACCRGHRRLAMHLRDAGA